MFTKLENNRPFAKVAFEGNAGSGKTLTSSLLAMGIHKLIKSKKPIAVFDTEKAFKALSEVFENEGIDVMIAEGERSLKALSQAIDWCEAGNADILIIDSITHVWENFIQAYKADKRRSQLQFQDWGVIKPKWKSEFSDKFVMAKVHIIFSGRAGYEYDYEDNGRGGKDLVKTGIKMKAEGETAYEPDMLVLMERFEDVLGAKKTIFRQATVIKDRTTKIDGKTFKNPTFKDFEPAINVLLKGVVKDKPTDTIADTFDDIQDNTQEFLRHKNLSLAEIKGAFDAMGLGSSTEDKKLKAWILDKVFGVNSLDALDLDRTIKLSKIQSGERIIKEFQTSYLKYLQDCNEEGLAKDPKRIADMLKDLLSDENFLQ